MNVPRGKYQLRVRRIGYSAVALTLDITSDTLIAVRLASVPRILDSVRIVEERSGYSFEAVVLDDYGLPVVDAEFVAEGINNKLRTDATGRILLRNPPRGTLMVRVRRVGYEAFFGTVQVEGHRHDTLRMARLPPTLSQVDVLARSGFGRDTFLFAELYSRQAWKGTGAGVIGREELDALGRTNLCEALPRTQTGARLGLRLTPGCSVPVCVLINGDRPALRPLSMFRADDIEAVEYYPRGADWSGTIFARASLHCYPRILGSRGPGRQPGGWVIWLRNQEQSR